VLVVGNCTGYYYFPLHHSTRSYFFSQPGAFDDAAFDDASFSEGIWSETIEQQSSSQVDSQYYFLRRHWTRSCLFSLPGAFDGAAFDDASFSSEGIWSETIESDCWHHNFCHTRAQQSSQVELLGADSIDIVS
jgi:hypothetical protein